MTGRYVFDGSFIYLVNDFFCKCVESSFDRANGTLGVLRGRERERQSKRERTERLRVVKD